MLTTAYQTSWCYFEDRIPLTLSTHFEFVFSLHSPSNKSQKGLYFWKLINQLFNAFSLLFQLKYIVRTIKQISHIFLLLFYNPQLIITLIWGNLDGQIYINQNISNCMLSFHCCATCMYQQFQSPRNVCF